MTDLERAIRDAIHEVRGHKTEHVVVLDREGIPLWVGRGTRRWVASPEDVLPGGVVVHTHPTGGTFSRQDISLAITSDQREVIAVGPHYCYRLRRPRSGWRPLPLVVEQIIQGWERARRSPMHDELVRLVGVWPGLEYERIRLSDHGETFVAGAAGVERAL